MTNWVINGSQLCLWWPVSHFSKVYISPANSTGQCFLMSSPKEPHVTLGAFWSSFGVGLLSRGTLLFPLSESHEQRRDRSTVNSDAMTIWDVWEDWKIGEWKNSGQNDEFGYSMLKKRAEIHFTDTLTPCRRTSKDCLRGKSALVMLLQTL